MTKLIMPGDTEAPNGLDTAQGVANWAEIARRVQATALNLDLSAGRFVQQEYKRSHNNAAMVFTNNAFSAYNGGAITEHAKHTMGTAPSTESQDIEDLLTSRGISDSDGASIGTFYVAKVMAGSGTAHQNQTISGTYASLVCGTDCRGWVDQEHKLGTYGMFVRKISGQLAIGVANPSPDEQLKHRDNRVDGVSVNANTSGGLSGYEITTSDWTYIEKVIETGYDHVYHLDIDASPGAEYLIAWPEFTTIGACKGFIPNGARA